MRERQHKELIIIGAGPIGMCCGIEATRAGIDYLILEKGALVNSVFHFPTNMTFFSTSQLLEIGGVPFISHGEKPTRREALEYFRRVSDKWSLKIHFYEEVTEVSKQDGIFHLRTTKADYSCRFLIVATGFYGMPRLMDVPGEDLPHVKHYYDEPHPYVGQKVAVIGAANSACDVALELYHKGAEVTMVIREKEINPRVKYWIKPNIENRIKEGSIKAHFRTLVKEIRKSGILINGPDGEHWLDCDFVLAMTGYQPDIHFLQQLGLEFSEDEEQRPQYDEGCYETNIPDLYLAGVVCGGLKTNVFFIENSRDHAEKILADISTKIRVAS